MFFICCGGEDGDRTHARLASPSSFRNCPLRPLGYFSSGCNYITKNSKYYFLVLLFSISGKILKSKEGEYLEPMKKFVYLLLVATSLLVTSCSGDAPNEPKFKKYSRKVDFATFTAELNDRGSEFYFEGSEIDSFVSKNDVYTTISKTLKNSARKTDEAVTQTERDIYKFQYDKSDSILSIDRQNDLVTLQESVGGKQASVELTDNMSYAVQFEELDVNGEKDLIAYTKSNKAYYNLGKVDKEVADKSSASIASYGIIIPLLSYIKAMSIYDRVTDAEKAKFNFYSDDDVFTITYVLDETIDVVETFYTETDPVTVEEVVVGKETTTRDVKIQILVSKNNLQVAYKDKGQIVTTYTKDAGRYYVGDVETQYALESCQASIERKSVSLKRISMSSYTKLDSPFDVESLFE